MKITRVTSGASGANSAAIVVAGGSVECVQEKYSNVVLSAPNAETVIRVEPAGTFKFDSWDSIYDPEFGTGTKYTLVNNGGTVSMRSNRFVLNGVMLNKTGTMTLAKVKATGKGQVVVEDGTLTISRRPSGDGSGGGGFSHQTTYPVTAPDKTDNGSVSVNPKSAKQGDTVTITVTPDKGYIPETITVTDKDGKKLTVTKKSDTRYTFVMPAGKVKVKVTFMDDNTMLNYFVDVKAADYYYDAVLWAAQKGITGGIGDGKFSPNTTCTREQAVAFLYRAADSPAVSGGSAFSDVAANAYYATQLRGLWRTASPAVPATASSARTPPALVNRR